MEEGGSNKKWMSIGTVVARERERERGERERERERGRERERERGGERGGEREREGNKRWTHLALTSLLNFFHASPL